jgi:hypothetical protein
VARLSSCRCGVTAARTGRRGRCRGCAVQRQPSGALIGSKFDKVKI